MKAKISLLLGLFFLFGPFCLAQEQDFDASTDWSKVDFSTLSADDWGRIDQSQIPIEYVYKIPPQYLKVDQLLRAAVPELTYEQISHEDNIEKVAVDELKPAVFSQYIKDKFQNSEVDLKKGACIGGCTLKGGVLQNGARGKSVTLGKFPEETKFSLLTDQAGTIQATVKGGTEIKDIPSTDEVTIILQKESTQGIKLPMGVVLNRGELNYENGQTSINKLKKTELAYQGRKLDINTQFNGVDVYFGQLPDNPGTNYLAWRDNDLVASGSGFMVDFPPGSGFFKQESKNPEHFAKNKVSLQPKTGTITFNFAGDKPALKIEGEAEIKNGKYILDFRKDRLFSNVYNLREDKEIKSIGMNIAYQGRTMKIEDDGSVEYGRTKHFEMAWSGDIKRDVDKIMGDLKKLKTAETKDLLVWVETKNQGGNDAFAFDTARSIMENTLAPKNILTIPIRLGELDAEKNKDLLNQLYGQTRREGMTMLAFGHSQATIDVQAQREDLRKNWPQYSEKLSPGTYAQAERQIMGQEAIDENVLTEAIAARLDKSSLTPEQYSQRFNAYKNSFMKHNLLIDGNEEDKEKIFTVPKEALPPIGCSLTEAASGKKMNPEEAAMVTVRLLHRTLNQKNNPDWNQINQELKNGMYKFPDAQSARKVEEYMNNYQAPTLLGKASPKGWQGRRDWCISAPGKRCA